MTENYALRLKNLSKSFPGVKAVDDVTLDFVSGEVHALIGENGAGKSTLIKCISGALCPDEGTITIGDHEFNELDPLLAIQNGVEVIYQEFNLISSLSVAENIFLNRKTSNNFIVNKRERENLASNIIEQLEVELAPSELVRELSPAYQQIVEISKAISRDVKVLIMDEPTAPLTVSEVEILFKIIRDLKEKGVTIIYISHRIEELFEVADKVSVMRDGKYIDTKDIRNTNRKELIDLMVGRDLTEAYPSRKNVIGEEIFRVVDLSGNGVSEINFNLQKGEILGFAGLVGAGRSELMQLIFGAEPISSGEMFLAGKPIQNRYPGDAIKNSIGLIPEDRKKQGVFLRQTIKWNVVINAIRKICNRGVVNTTAENEIAEEYTNKFSIKTPSLNQIVSNLSGGNQQKVAIAKAMAAKSQILIFDEPTRGIDVGSKQEIYKLMNELVETGHSIMMVSSDMPELLGMSDRIVVIAEGRQTGILLKNEFNQNKILDLASIEN